MENDSSNLIKDLRGKDEVLADIGPIIDDCRFLLQAFPFAEVAHVQREGNQCAHAFAKYGLTIDSELVWIENGPKWSMPYLLRDVPNLVF